MKHVVDKNLQRGWTGDLLIGSAFALFRGRVADDTALHKHYAAQLVYGEENVARIERASGAISIGRELFVPSNESHRLFAASSPTRILFFEPGVLQQDNAVELLKTLLRSPTWHTVTWSDHLAFPPTTEPRIRSALDHLAHHIDCPIGATELAAIVGLSRSRFMALFSRELGIPVRRYILWLRLKQAATALAGGTTVTQAAHAAGFSDLAHFSRTMRATFGVTASESLQQLSIAVT